MKAGPVADQVSAPPAPVTGKAAFAEMYINARKNWSTDVVLLHLSPKDMPGFKNEAGRGPVWEAILASPSLSAYRIYTYSIAACPPDIYKGVVVGRVLPWFGITRDVMAVQTSDFVVDSDRAYDAAVADASAWLKRHPDKKLATIELGNAYRFPAPVWHLMWGDKKSGYVALINATTGTPIKGKSGTARPFSRGTD